MKKIGLKILFFWELEVIKLVGYDINFNNYVDSNNLNNNHICIDT